MLHSKRNRNTANSKSHIHVMSVLRRDVVPRPPKAPKKSHDPKKWGREQSPKPIHHHRTPQNPTQPNHHRAPGSSTEQQTDGSKPQVSTAVFIPAQTIWGSGQNHVWVCSRSDVGCLCSFTFCLNLRPDPTEAFWRFRSTTREEVQKLKKVYLTETRWERQKTFCSRSESQSSKTHQLRSQPSTTSDAKPSFYSDYHMWSCAAGSRCNSQTQLPIQIQTI